MSESHDEMVKRVALEVAGDTKHDDGTDEWVLDICTRFLARIDAERGKDAVAWDVHLGGKRLAPCFDLDSARVWRNSGATVVPLFLSPTIPAGMVQTKAARDVLAERQRQISAEGWTPKHDDTHGDGEDYLESLSCPVVVTPEFLIEQAETIADQQRTIEGYACYHSLQAMYDSKVAELTAAQSRIAELERKVEYWRDAARRNIDDLGAMIRKIDAARAEYKKGAV